MWYVWDLWEGGLDKIGRVVYNRFIVNTKRKSQNLQRFGGNQSPNPVHYPGRCYSFEIIVGCAELAYAIKTSSVLRVSHNIEEG